MENHIDIHSHILPGMDDGAENLEISFRMLEIASRSQISHIILTPHNKPARRNASPEQIAMCVGKMQEAADEKKIGIKLYAGSELYYRDGLAGELERGEAMTLAGSHYVLVEFSPVAEYDYMRNAVYSLQMNGFWPILAHVERYRNMAIKPDRVGELFKMGCYIQANAGSIMGRYGFGAKRMTRKLLKQRLLHFVATDAHDCDRRAPELSGCAAYLAEKYGGEYAGELLRENPLRVLSDRYITE